MRKGAHIQYDLQYHVVWITKYRRKILNGKIADRLKVLLMQGCSAKNITIIKGNIQSDHVHLLISPPTSLSVAQIMQYLKGSTSKMLQDEFPNLKKKYWEQHIWGTGYFVRTVGTVTEEMIRNYVESQNDEVHEIFGD